MVDWSNTFVPQAPPLDIVVRGTVVYLALYAMLRVILKREAGTTGMTDLLVIVLIADAAQNAMADDYKTVPDGLLLVAVIVGWAWFLDFLAYRFAWTRRLLRPRPLLLVRNGQMLRKNMRQELITRRELIEQLREQGIDDLSRVREARMESDGRFSVVPASDQQSS